MPQKRVFSAAEIRARRAEHPDMRARDFAVSLDISEGELVAAYCGRGATRIASHPDQLMPAASELGTVMALTRNLSCVHEKVGQYGNYRAGDHAAMVLNDAIDLRMFPSQWCHAFAVEEDGKKGTRRSIQVFDAAGDAIHKIHLREQSDLAAWAQIVPRLAAGDQNAALPVLSRKPTEPARSNPEKRDILLREWDRLTDTHQFLRLTSKLRMNRLGAYRIAGEPYARLLSVMAVDEMLTRLQAGGIESMIFVGNKGCIQIHSGPIETLKPMGPWQNVMDPGFNLHLRRDHVAEVWAVSKPTSRGPAVSVEAFDADGGLIFQAFGRRGEQVDHRPAWDALVAGLPSVEQEVC